MPAKFTPRLLLQRILFVSAATPLFWACNVPDATQSINTEANAETNAVEANAMDFDEAEVAELFAEPQADETTSAVDTVACAQIPEQRQYQHAFPFPAELTANVAFWVRVYTEWPNNRYAIHDDVEMDIVYQVVAANDGREPAVAKAKTDVTAALKRLDRQRPRNDSRLTGTDLAVYRAFGQRKNPDRFRRALGHVRHQKGQADRFADALQSGNRYRTEMENILDDAGLPRELIAIVFIESMFQLNAQSFVGAAGPWQFMPATGREYMTLSRVIDERHDPIIATRAAARYLRSAKRLLEEWPLAVTSYNYGMGGMRKAARQTESTDLVQIFKMYKGKRMGFAARNYYAEFLAALHVLERSESCFAGLQLEPKWSYELVTLDRDVKATDLYAAEVFNARVLADLNPGIRKEALAGTVDLPVGMQLRVPEGMAEHFMTGLAMLQPPTQDGNIDEEMKTHRVRPGDNVTRIAHLHGVSVHAVLAANNIKPHDVIYPNMLLRIPQTTPSSSLRSE